MWGIQERVLRVLKCHIVEFILSSATLLFQMWSRGSEKARHLPDVPGRAPGRARSRFQISWASALHTRHTHVVHPRDAIIHSIVTGRTASAQLILSSYYIPGTVLSTAGITRWITQPLLLSSQILMEEEKNKTHKPLLNTYWEIQAVMERWGKCWWAQRTELLNRIRGWAEWRLWSGTHGKRASLADLGEKHREA